MFSRLKIVVEYCTSRKATALQWLSLEQTSGKKHPFLFSQCQVIHSSFIVIMLKPEAIIEIDILGHSLSLDDSLPRHTRQQSDLQRQGSYNFFCYFTYFELNDYLCENLNY